ncbi:hypothetical protein [uncultured Neptuniibacter sp.]|uniref:hypothetical protein n=1 Tax=uncultured Neptuniibacter sp. TaxID=502143 RepID=UPI00261FEA6E|nr:hypothetical protein [uncultured Neptuniibacter sp.]
MCLTVTLTGCITTAKPVKYLAPSNSNASLILQYERSKIEGDGKVALIHIYKDAERCKGKQIAGFMQPGGQQKLAVSSESPLSFSITSFTLERHNNLNCNLYGTFTPQANTAYYATYTFTNERCTVKAYGRNQTGIVAVDLEQRRYKNDSWSDDPSWCK